jgi:hypothetical protein
MSDKNKEYLAVKGRCDETLCVLCKVLAEVEGIVDDINITTESIRAPYPPG